MPSQVYLELEHRNRRKGHGDWSDKAANQGTPRNADSQGSWKRQGMDSPSEPEGRAVPATPGFQTSGLQNLGG